VLTLRDYQLALTADARSLLKQGCKRLLVQSSTGSGKTVLAAHLLARASERGRRSWFVVHRKELLAQAVETFVTAADLHVGIIAAGYPSDAAAPVQVCAVGSLKRRLSAVRAPDMIVWDECHHLPSKSWTDIAAALPNAVHIGLTATPARLDGRGLRPYFDALLCGPSTADLIAAGYLSPYRLFAPAQFDASALHKVAGDYNRKEVAATMKPTVIGDAVGTYLRHADGGRALVFAWSLEASRAIADAFVMAGVPARHVDGETPSAERAESMRAFRSGDVRVVCNCELFGEGLDVPAVDSVFLLRPTASLGLYLQQCGRGLRPAPGKPAVRLFDHVGNYTRHGLPDDPRTWTLDGIAKSARETLPPTKRCAMCFAVTGAAVKACPFCGAVYPVKQRTVVQVAGELQETELSALRARVTEFARECRTLSDWQALGKKMGYAHGWAWFRWQHATARKRLRPALNERASQYEKQPF
jgi:DNA repair protein RadD